MPSLMWRIDKEWRGLRHNTPWVKRPPSEYIREHIRLTLQPTDASLNSEHLFQFIDPLGSEEILMFSFEKNPV